MRVAALEDRIAADLERGLDSQLVGELKELVTRHPLRERPRGQLMLALYRAGRQAEALEAYAEARKVLVEEVGIEPGPELQELQRTVLEQDPSLRPRRRPEDTSAGTDSFVGRTEEWARLEGSLDRALAGRGGVVLIAGEPGIGKSRLAEELAGAARGAGARVLVGRCWEAGGAPAYWPWVQSLRDYVGDTEPETLRALLAPAPEGLLPLLPELRDLYPDLPETPAVDSEGARFRLFDAAGAFLRRATRDTPIVLVLDDVHAADEPSLLLLQFVARQIADSRLLAVCAYRDVAPTVSPALAAVVAQLAREPHTTQVELQGLRPGDVAEYIERATGAPAGEALVAAIHAETEGNPLFVSEVVRLLSSQGRLAEPDVHRRIPPGVRAVIGQRVEGLSDECRTLLVQASVLGREFGLKAIAELSALHGDELLGLLDEAMGERVLGELPGSPGRVRFAHALIRDALYDELTAARRLQLHAQAGEALESVYAGDAEGHLAELAHHFCAAAPAGTADKALEYASRAAARAAAQLAYEEAVRLYGMALALVPDGRRRCELLLALGDAQARAGDTPGSKGSFREAAEIAGRNGLGRQLARAALGYGGRIVWEVSRDDPDLVPLLERGLEAVGDDDPGLRVRLLARLAGGPLREAHDPARRLALSDEALELARASGDAATIAYALSGYIAAHHSPDYTPAQATLATEQIEAGISAGDLERAAEGYEHRVTALLELGDAAGAKADLAEMAQLAERLRQPSQDWFVAVYGALLAFFEGDLAEAESLMERARRIGERAQSWNAAVSWRLQLYVLRREQGRLSEIEGMIRRSVDEYSTYPIWGCVATQAITVLGHAEEARGRLSSLVADDVAALPFDEEWLVSASLLAEAANLLGDSEAAAVLYERLLPYADRVSLSYPEISLGFASRYLGLLATTLDRYEDAALHFEHSLASHERTGARSWLAHTRRDYAGMLLVRGEEDDAARAAALLSEARDAYRALGMDHWGSVGS
jgi:tetratricopeptide (TPR) repeat protein